MNQVFLIAVPIPWIISTSRIGPCEVARRGSSALNDLTVGESGPEVSPEMVQVKTKRNTDELFFGALLVTA